MEKRPVKPPEVVSTEVIEHGPHAGFILTVLSEQTPEQAREELGFQTGKVGTRGVPKMYTTASGIQTRSGSNHKPRN